MRQCNECGNKNVGSIGKVVTCNVCSNSWSDEPNNKKRDGWKQPHICRCLVYDRKTCPVCQKPCHHDTTCRQQVTTHDDGGTPNTEKAIPNIADKAIIDNKMEVIAPVI